MLEKAQFRGVFVSSHALSLYAVVWRLSMVGGPWSAASGCAVSTDPDGVEPVPSRSKTGVTQRLLEGRYE